jgi:hypothetical protein
LVPVAKNRGEAPSPVALRALTSARAAGRGEQAKSFSRRDPRPSFANNQILVTTGLDPVVHVDARLLKQIG